MRAILVFQDRKPWIDNSEPGRHFYDYVVMSTADGVRGSGEESARFRVVLIECESLVAGLAQAREHETPSDSFVNCCPLYEEPA